MKSLDGGPAFPHAWSEGEAHYLQVGMSLRDWFAGQALAGYLASWTQRGVETKQAATAAYEYAEAMLRERALEDITDGR